MAKNKKSDDQYCAFPHCRNESDLLWLTIGVCQNHFAWICEQPKEKVFQKLKMKAKTEEPCDCFSKKKG